MAPPTRLLQSGPLTGFGPDVEAGLRPARVLSWIVVVLMVVASAAGLLIRDLYQDPEPVVTLLRGNDLVTLVAAAPLLLAALASARRWPARAQLVWAGVLAYTVYAYATVVFGTTFNALFLVHVALFSLAVFALVVTLSRLDVDAIAASVNPGARMRWISVLLGVLGGGLGGVWAFYAIRFAVTGAPPEESYLVLPIAAVHLAHVLDLALLVPGYLLSSVLLWQRAPWGYVLAGMLLVSGSLQQLQYMTALVFQAAARIPGAIAFDPQEPLIALAFAAAALTLLKNVRKTPRFPRRSLE